MFLLYTLLAHAEGARCVATWQADAKACGIEGSLMTSATGPSMEAAGIRPHQPSPLRRVRLV